MLLLIFKYHDGIKVFIYLTTLDINGWHIIPLINVLLLYNLLDAIVILLIYADCNTNDILPDDIPYI